ncbi:hypothetical protein Q7C36_003594 [Tachysurus vachellii]|uniref:Microtubule-associated protein 1A/B/S-like MBL-like domain-containing protein n=1 Tax=Tachysurus vachellii TaxID=175792 RepID=A0AA88NWP5_TACVA|nr:hypothetical protein Q7C36_003594 [Tachysurus vachellii]
MATTMPVSAPKTAAATPASTPKMTANTTGSDHKMAATVPEPLSRRAIRRKCFTSKATILSAPRAVTIPTPVVKIAAIPASQPLPKMAATSEPIHKMAASPTSPAPAKPQLLVSSLLDPQITSVRVSKSRNPVLSSLMIPRATEEWDECSSEDELKPKAKSSFPDRAAGDTGDNSIANETPVEDQIIQVLFPGSTPQTKKLEGLEKLKHLEFLKRPVVCSKDMEPKSEKHPKGAESQDSIKSQTKESRTSSGTTKEKSVHGNPEPKDKVKLNPEKSTDDVLNPVKFTEASGNIENPKTEHSINLHFTPTEFRQSIKVCISPDEKTLELSSPKSGPNSAGHTPYHISPEETWASSDRSSLAAKMCLGSDSQQGASRRTSESGCPKSTKESNSSSSKEKHSSFLSLSCFKDIIPDISPSVTTTTHSMPAAVSSPQSTEVDGSLSMSFEQVLPTESESTNEDKMSYSNGHYGDPDFKVGMSLSPKMANYELSAWPKMVISGFPELSAWPEPTNFPVICLLLQFTGIGQPLYLLSLFTGSEYL